MVDIPSSSFIPKQGPGSVPSNIRRRRTFSVFGFIATVLLFGSLIFAGGTYVYKQQVYKHLEDVKAQLVQQKNLFRDEDIAVIERFDRQLKFVDFLLNNHVAPSKIFTDLELNTMERIQFTEFEYEYDPAFEINLTITGGTEEFKTVALQADAFGGSGILKQVIFSEIGTSAAVLDSQGTTAQPSSNENEVTFTIEGSMLPTLLAYDGLTDALSPSAQVSDQVMTSDTQGMQAAGVVNEVTP